MKSLSELLAKRVSLEERIKEILEVCPSIASGKQVYYDKTSYIRYEDETLYAGLSNRKYETKINMAFPCVFYLSGLYLAKDLAEKYTSNEKMKEDKSLYINEDVLLCMKDYGVIGNESFYREIINSYKEDEVVVEEMLANIDVQENPM